MKKYFMTALFINVLCLSFQFFAMAPARIAELQNQFRRYITAFKSENTLRRGFSEKAVNAEDEARRIIDELKNVTDVKWMQVALNTEIKNREENFGVGCHASIRKITNALGIIGEKGTFFARGSFGQAGTDFYKNVENNVLKDLYKILQERIDIASLARYYQLPTLTDIGGLGGAFYLLNKQHKDFIAFANVLGTTTKGKFYNNSDPEYRIIDQIKTDIASLIDKLYYHGTGLPASFGTTQNNILTRPASNTLNKLGELQTTAGGFLYHINQDFNYYRNLMVFAGGGDDIINIPMAIDAINQAVIAANKSFKTNLQLPFKNNKDNATMGEKPITFGRLLERALSMNAQIMNIAGELTKLPVDKLDLNKMDQDQYIKWLTNNKIDGFNNVILPALKIAQEMKRQG